MQPRPSKTKRMAVKAFCTSTGSGVVSRKRLRRLQSCCLRTCRFGAESEYGHETEHMQRQPELQGCGQVWAWGWGSELQVHTDPHVASGMRRGNPLAGCTAQLFGTVDSRCVRKQHILQVAGLVKVVRSFFVRRCCDFPLAWVLLKP